MVSFALTLGLCVWAREAPADPSFDSSLTLLRLERGDRPLRERGDPPLFAVPRLVLLVVVGGYCSAVVVVVALRQSIYISVYRCTVRGAGAGCVGRRCSAVSCLNAVSLATLLLCSLVSNSSSEAKNQFGRLQQSHRHQVMTATLCSIMHKTYRHSVYFM